MALIRNGRRRPVAFLLVSVVLCVSFPRHISRCTPYDGTALELQSVWFGNSFDFKEAGLLVNTAVVNRLNEERHG